MDRRPRGALYSLGPNARDDSEEVYSPRDAGMVNRGQNGAVTETTPVKTATFYYWDHLGTIRMTAGENPTADRSSSTITNPTASRCSPLPTRPATPTSSPAMSGTRSAAPPASPWTTCTPILWAQHGEVYECRSFESER